MEQNASFSLGTAKILNVQQQNYNLEPSKISQLQHQNADFSLKSANLTLQKIENLQVSLTKDDAYVAKLRFAKRIRNVLQDYAQKNRFYGTEQVSDEFIFEAIDVIIDRFNRIPPNVGQFNILNFPSLDLLEMGVLARIFEALALLEARNAYPVQAGEVQIQNDKTDRYMQLAQYYSQLFDVNAGKWKTYLNVQMGYQNWWSF